MDGSRKLQVLTLLLLFGYTIAQDCNSNEFMCHDRGNGTSGVQCIPSSWKCDGTFDCDKCETCNLDETAALCCENGFWCSQTVRCIDSSLVCDGTTDCGSGNEDEQECYDYGVTCPELLAPEHGSVDPNDSDFTEDTSLTFTCESGYLLEGASSTVCQSDGTWTASVPVCRKLCSELSAPEHGSVSPIDSDFSEGTTLTFTCDSEYLLDGAPSIDCQSDGTWTASVPTCNDDASASCDTNCEQITDANCPYSNTGFPNFFDHPDQATANEVAEYIDLVEATNCYVNSREFLCRLLLPECIDNQGLVFPDFQTCEGFYAGCSLLLTATGNEHLIFDCDEFDAEPEPQCNAEEETEGESSEEEDESGEKEEETTLESTTAESTTTLESSTVDESTASSATESGNGELKLQSTTALDSTTVEDTTDLLVTDSTTADDTIVTEQYATGSTATDGVTVEETTTGSNDYVTGRSSCSQSCEPITIPQCASLSYSHTGFPNYFNHTGQTSAFEIAGYIDAIEDFECSDVSTTFLCGLLVPKCMKNQGIVVTDRQTCVEFFAGCSDMLRATENEGLILDCDEFPEVPEPACMADDVIDTTTVDDVIDTTAESTTMSESDYVTGRSSCSQSCEPITISQCTSLSYSYTGFPNYFNHMDQTSAGEIAGYIDAIEAFRCSAVSTKFLCGLLVPKCMKNQGIVGIDRQTCVEFFAGCSDKLIETENEGLILDCDEFPEVPEPACMVEDVIDTTAKSTTMSESDYTTAGSSCSQSCESITISQCALLSYSHTGFPNYFNHMDQIYAGDIAYYINVLEAFNCSNVSTKFLCGLLVPKCMENQGLVGPDRKTCVDFFAGCTNILMQTENEGLILDCDEFPEVPEPLCMADDVIATTEESTTVSESDNENNPYKTPPCLISCEHVEITQCQSQSYSMTGFPNYFEHQNQTAANAVASYIDVVEEYYKCYEHSREMLCGLLLPECVENEGLIYPSRQMCVEFFEGCGPTLIETGNEELILDCREFPVEPEPMCTTRQHEMPQPDITDDIMFVTDIGTENGYQGPKLFMGSVDAMNLIEIPVTGLKHPLAVDFDPKERKVYWTDTGTKSISRASLDGSDQVELVTTTGGPEGLVLDTTNRNMYWTDAENNWIETSSMDGNDRHRVVETDLDRPLAIVIDPFTSCLFWIDGGENPKIEKVNIDGSLRVTLVGSDLSQPNGLAIDLVRKELYWCDTDLNRIERVDFTGLFRFHFDLAEEYLPFDIGIYKNVIYWSDRNKNSLGVVDRFTWIDAKVLQSFFYQVGGVHIYQVDSGITESDVCRLEEYQCTNPGVRVCILKSEFCNGIVDCADGEDEEDCATDCATNAFACSNRTSGPDCIPSSWRCDEFADCVGGEDEIDCPVEGCGEDQFECQNKTGPGCISNQWVCDGIADCAGGGDEADCPDEVEGCWIGEFECQNKTGNGCISNEWVCDGIADCAGGADEADCPDEVEGCGEDQFECQNKTGPGCISNDWVCDGIADCAGGADEADCPDEDCGANAFACSSGTSGHYCIPSSWRCDEFADCVGGEDEVDCPPCNEAEFDCILSGDDFPQCIPDSKVCDGTLDCFNFNDEFNCSAETCSENQHVCPVQSSDYRTCIDAREICDKWEDCADASDESNCEACNETQYECFLQSEGYPACLPTSKVCDSIVDCFGVGDDEFDCPNTTCREDQHICSAQDDNHRTCIDTWEICDGWDDCSDAADESNCQTCSATEHKCVYTPTPYGYPSCIPTSKICDGIVDCYGYGDDEFNCPFTTCTDEQYTCPVQSVFNRTCLEEWERCDGHFDCSDGNDEAGCTACSDSSYQCPVVEDGFRTCIGDWEVCDGFKDCADEADEYGCETEVRLVNGANNNEGRLEVFYGLAWGTVCDDSFGDVDATIVCRQLGLPYQNAHAIGNAPFGEGSGWIWLDNVHCVGSETWLDECGHNGWGITDCDHNEDVGVVCE